MDDASARRLRQQEFEGSVTYGSMSGAPKTAQNENAGWGKKGDLRGAVRAHQESPGKPAKVRENEVDKPKKMGLMVSLPAPLFDVVLVVLRHLKYA